MLTHKHKRRDSFRPGVGPNKPLASLKSVEELQQLLIHKPSAKRWIPVDSDTVTPRRRTVPSPINYEPKTKELTIHEGSPLPKILDDKTREGQQLEERLTQLFNQVSKIDAKIDVYKNNFEEIHKRYFDYQGNQFHDSDDYNEKEFYSKEKKNKEFDEIKKDYDSLVNNIISDHDKIKLLTEQFATLLTDIREFKAKFSLDRIEEEFKKKISSFQPELKKVESELRSLTEKNQYLTLTKGGKRKTKNNRKKRFTNRKSSKNRRRR